ncbi:unnamed protein product [Linum trigynum]|uniref:Bifunctional inhibitor/plant lipid transfer protein/seed storage helical domain-containing protein n=1 Tax=Linum trigynum TaxID=586398 RepID=A0AAV2CZP4_9ROSI
MAVIIMNKCAKPGLAAAAAVLLVVATLLVAAEAECGVDVGNVVSSCGQFVSKGGPKTPPSPQCCNALNGADVPCACKNLLTPTIQGLIDMNKAVFVGRSCGLSIPAGMKCGSK